MIALHCPSCRTPLPSAAEECPTCRASGHTPAPRKPLAVDSPLARAHAALRRSHFRQPLERALRRIRQSQWIDLAAYMTVLLLTMGLTRMTGTATEPTEGERADGEWMAPLDFPGDGHRGFPTARDAAAHLLTERSWLCLLPILPSLLLFASGFLAMVGRFRLAWYGVESGAGRAFTGTALLGLGRALCGLLAGLLVVWLVFGPEQSGGRGAAALPSLAGLFLLAGLLGVFGEIMSLPGLALLAWRQASTDEHRHRIGMAAGFYPLQLAALFLVVLAVTLLPVVGVDLTREAVFVLSTMVLIVQAIVPIIQLPVFDRAYRFPSAE